MFKHFSLKKIENSLKELGIDKNSYIIDKKDFTVSLTKSIVITNKTLEECPVEFSRSFDFWWTKSNLKSLKNLPKIVNGDLIISKNKIRNFVDSDVQIVNGDFDCSHNEIDSLKNSPSAVWGDYDCSFNKLKNLEGVTKNCNVISKGNLIPITDPTTNTELVQPSKEKDVLTDNTVDTKPITIEDDLSQLSIDDKVIMTDPESKYNGRVGYVYKTPLLAIDEGKYAIKFIFSENPGLIDLASDSYKNKKELIIAKIKRSSFKKIEGVYKDSSSIDYTNHETPTTINNIIIKHSANTFYKGEVVEYYNSRAILVSLVSPTFWKIKYIESYLEHVQPFEVDYIVLKKPKIKFKVNDSVIYKNIHNSILYDKEGIIIGITPSSYHMGVNFLNINFLNDDGTIKNVDHISFFDVKLKLEDIEYNKIFNIKNNTNVPISNTTQVNYGINKIGNKGGKKFLLNDRVIYISSKTESIYKDYHLCKGIISYTNVYSDLYDIKIPIQNNVTVEKTLYSIKPDQIMLDNIDLEVEDRIVINNGKDIEEKFLDKIGIITKKYVDDDSEANGEQIVCDLVFNINKTPITIFKIPIDKLTKYVKLTGDEIKINDAVIYTKPDSEYYGFKGVVTDKTSGDPVLYNVDLNDEENDKVIQTSTNVENLVITQIERGFKKGDIVIYNCHDGVLNGKMGKISKVYSKTSNLKGYFSVEIKIKNNSVYVTASAKNLTLIEEASDDVKNTTDKSKTAKALAFGDSIKYVNPNSKYDGMVGFYQGERIKDGKKQKGIKFDTGVSNVIKYIYVEEGEGEIIPFAKVQPVSVNTNTVNSYTNYVNNTNTNTNYNYNYTAPAKKKKKKEKIEEELPPVLVYNRRNVAKRKFKKKDENSA